MEITLTQENFKQIQRVCSPAASKDKNRPILNYIQLLSDGEKVTATALDGFVLAQTVVPCEGDAGEFWVQPQKSVPKCAWVKIKQEDREVTVEYVGKSSTSYTVESGDYVKWPEILHQELGEPEAEIYFNPDLMRQAMESLKGDGPARFFIHSPVRPVFVSTATSKVMVLPVLPPQ